MYAFSTHEAMEEGQRERERENLKQAPCPAWAGSHDPEIMT